MRSRRKVGMTSSQHGPYVPGYTRATMGRTTSRKLAIVSQSLKPAPSSDWRLQLASMKSESLVNADQLRCVEYVPGPCTHRPSRHLSLVYPKPSVQPQGARRLRCAREGGRSRTKVAVSEGAAGSPPF